MDNAGRDMLRAMAMGAGLVFGAAPALACDGLAGTPWATPLTQDAASGAPLTLGWNDPAPGCGMGARYLVLAMPPEARLSGQGFAALGPGDAAPFGIDFAADRLRAVIPLHLEGYGSGTLAIEPHLIGEMALDWAIVHLPDPAAPVAQVSIGDGARIAIRPGIPRIVVQDPFDTESPLETHLSNDGRWRMEVFAGHYRVLDAATGALIHDGEGILPRFSPTGRFVHVFHAEGDAAELATEIAGLSPEEYILFADFSVHDLVTGAEALSIRRGGWSGRGDFITALHWSPGDSYLAVFYEAQGMMGFQPMFVDRPYFREEFGCGACSPQAEGIASIDSENGLATLGWAGNVRHISLFSDPPAEPLTYLEMEEPPRPPYRLLVETAVYSGFNLTNWPEGLRIVDLLGGSRASFETGFDARTDRLVSHQVVQGGARMAAADLTGDGAAMRGGSGLLLAAAAELNRETRVLQRLADFGIGALAAPETPHARIAVAYRFDDGRYLTDDEWPEDDWTEDDWTEDDWTEDDWTEDDWNAPHFTFDIGAAAIAARLADTDTAEALNAALRDMLAGSDICAVSPPFEADVWTFRRGAQVAQVVHYNCRVGTGREPEGALALIWAEPGDAGWRLLAMAPDYAILPDGSVDWFNPGSGGEVPVAAHQALRGFALSEGLLALLGVDGRAALLDTRDFSLRHEFQGLRAPEQVSQLALTADRRHLLQVNADGRWFLRRLGDGVLALSGVHVDDEVVAFDASLNFDATPEAARYVQLRFPGDRQLYTLDQIGARARADELVPRALRGAVLDPPEFRALPPRLLSARAEGGRLHLSAQAEGGLDQAVLFRDGAEVARLPLSGRVAEAVFDLPSQPETRWFTVQLRDREGLSSAPHAIAHSPDADGAPTGRLHVLAVGTDLYDDPGIADLRLAAYDAENFAQAMQAAEGRLYRAVLPDVLVDSADLRAELLPRLAALAERVAPEDTVFLHIAGHGFTDDTGALRLADRATRLDALDQTAIGFDEIAAALSALRGRVVVFLDACHSGAAGAGTNDDAVAALLASGAPVAVIAASKGRQESLESPGLGGGAFTAALIRVLGDPATDLDGNGALELTEIYATLKREVVQATRGQQTPWIARSAFVGAVPLY